MSSDDPEPDVPGEISEPEPRGVPACIYQAGFFLAGSGVTLPGRLVNKIRASAQRVLREQRRRLCP